MFVSNEVKVIFSFDVKVPSAVELPLLDAVIEVI